MKIAFLSFYSGQIDRGVEVATAALAQGLSKKYDVTVFQAGNRVTPTVKTIQLPIEKKWPTDTSSNPGRKFFFDYYSRQILRFTLAFIPYFLRERYDAIIPTNGGWQIPLCKWLSVRYGVRLLLQGNAGIGRDDAWQLFWRPNQYVAISPAGFTWAKKKASQVKIKYIPYGVDIEAIKKAEPADIKLARPIVLCVAALLPYKQISLLIHAMQQVRGASLLVVGHGPLEQEIKALGTRLLESRFHLLTNVKHQDLLGIYKTADLFSLPSRASEAFGIVYIEAMAAGLPIVAPDDLNRRAIIGEAGVFVDPTDSQAYAKAIEDALHTNFGNRPILQAARYSWDKIIAQYQEVLQSI